MTVQRRNSEMVDLLSADFVSRREVFLSRAYTPAWSSTGVGQPAIGDGTLAGRYIRIGHLVVAQARLVYGTTTTGGDGSWRLSLPYNALVSQTGTVFVFDSGTGTQGGMALVASGTNKMFLVPAAASANSYSATLPITWAAGDYLVVNIAYIVG